MSPRLRRNRLAHLAAFPTAFALSVVTTLAWSCTGGVDQIGPIGKNSESLVSLPVLAAPDLPAREMPHADAVRERSRPSGWATATDVRRPDRTDLLHRPLAHPALPRAAAHPGPHRVGAAATQSTTRRHGQCQTGHLLVPTCGILWGVAPGAHTESRGASALAAFERKTGRTQAIYHAYHGGIRQMFPTEQEIAIAHQPGRHRILFLNWKPEAASWAQIAHGDRRTDAYLDRLAEHIRHNFPEKFFFAVHHEGENDVREWRGSGYTARDYAAMYRYVIKRLRAHGVHNLVSVLVHMAYVKHATTSWFAQMYPGDDVVDWIGFDTYAYSDPGYGHGDFAEVFNRRLGGWPGFYTWAGTRHPGKPLMIAEWGVWSSRRHTAYKVDFYRELGNELRRFPRIKAMVQFETPHNQKGQDSSVDSTPAALQAYRRLGRLSIFQVAVRP